MNDCLLTIAIYLMLFLAGISVIIILTSILEAIIHVIANLISSIKSQIQIREMRKRYEHNLKLRIKIGEANWLRRK